MLCLATRPRRLVPRRTRSCLSALTLGRTSSNRINNQFALCANRDELAMTSTATIVG